jgi:hypothetical protein
MKKNKLQDLLKSKEQILKRLKSVEERMREEKDNEEMWPGHSSTRYFDDLNTLQVLKSHLEEIEKVISQEKTLDR